MRGPPLQTRVVAAYGAVLQLANMLKQTAGPDKLLALTDDPGAHGWNRGKAKMNGLGASKLERGQRMRRAVGMAGKGWQANKSLQNKALQADTADGLSVRLRPQRTATDGQPRSKNNSCRR